MTPRVRCTRGVMYWWYSLSLDVDWKAATHETSPLALIALSAQKSDSRSSRFLVTTVDRRRRALHWQTLDRILFVVFATHPVAAPPRRRGDNLSAAVPHARPRDPLARRRAVARIAGLPRRQAASPMRFVRSRASIASPL